MAIEKKLICFARLEEFERQLAAGNILDYSIVFIQDAKKIWTRGTYYDCNGGLDNVYITDFTVNDLENTIGSGSNVVADLTSLEEALAAHKVVLVPYDAGEGYIGYGLLVGYAEDLLYCVVYAGFDGLFYEIEATRGDTFIRDQSILKRTWSNKQDKLVSGTNIKTINGTSILGSGNIEIESGEENVQSDWNVTDTSSDAYIKNKPTIPTKTSQLTNDNGYLDRTAGDQSYIKSETVGESVYAYINGLTDEAMYYALPTSANGDEDDILLSQLTVKTINGESIVGRGNITISGGESFWYEDEEGSITTDEPVALGDAFIMSLSTPENGNGNDTYGVSGQVLTTNGERCYWADVPSGGGSSSGNGAYPEIIYTEDDAIIGSDKGYDVYLEPNKFYIFPECNDLWISLAPEVNGVANEYLFQFTSGSTATTLSLPSDLKWANYSAPTIEANMIYQVSILKGLASVLEFSNAAPVVLITFYYSGSPYSAEEGMTWEQWCNSTYNTTTLKISGGALTIGGMYPVYNSSGMPVYGTDVIIENEYYDMGQSGGG